MNLHPAGSDLQKFKTSLQLPAEIQTWRRIVGFFSAHLFLY
ncbi:hypothetical protein MPTK1_3g16385 [Marchantia polymorpha subsp. ruderalis]